MSAECTVPPPGWRCTREPGHDGPCAALPVEETLTGKELVEGEQERWPVVRIHRDKNASEGFGYMLTQPGAPASLPTEGDPSFVSSDYYPADSPNVLTQQEARLLVKARDDDELNVAEFVEAGELCNRLSAWAEGGS